MFIIPEKMEEYSKEELLSFRQQALFAIDELDAERKQIDELLMEKMEADTEFIDDYEVKRVTVSGALDVPVELARELGATRVEIPANTAKEFGIEFAEKSEKPDTAKLKALEKQGVELPHKAAYSYIKVKQLEGEES